MLKIRIIYGALALIVATGGLGGAGISRVQAQQAQGQTVAILDLGYVLGKSLAMQDADRQLRAIDSKIKEEIKAKEASFRQEQQDLAQQKVILSPEQFAAKSKALGKKGQKYRADFQKKLKQLSSGRAAAIRKIETTMNPIVSKIADQVGATMILEKSRILFGEKRLDISKKVLVKLNAKLKKIPVVLAPLKS